MTFGIVSVLYSFPVFLAVYRNGLSTDRIEKQNGEDAWVELEEIMNTIKGADEYKIISSFLHLDESDDEEENKDDQKEEVDELGHIEDLEEGELGPVHYK